MGTINHNFERINLNETRTLELVIAVTNIQLIKTSTEIIIGCFHICLSTNGVLN
jgi:hypothetical protein